MVSWLRGVNQECFLSQSQVPYLLGWAYSSDNIGVYTPLFAKYHAASQITALAVVFMAMTTVWCITAYYLVNHPLVASTIRRIGYNIFPFVLIGLGVYILTTSFLLI
jgi:cadmium resistance protein CadD (predicted permease)